MKKNIKAVETEEQRHSRYVNAGLGDAPIHEEVEAAFSDDWGAIKDWIDHYQIDQSEPMAIQLFDLCIAMGRKLHPKKPLTGRPKIWTDEIKGILVVEMERLLKNNPGFSVEHAIKQLSKKKPWISFIKTNSSSGDRADVIKQYYYESKDKKNTQRIRDAYELLVKIDSQDLWENTLALLENMSVKKYNANLITSFLTFVSSKKI